jgi:hypothetical protein
MDRLNKIVIKNIPVLFYSYVHFHYQIKDFAHEYRSIFIGLYEILYTQLFLNKRLGKPG